VSLPEEHLAGLRESVEDHERRLAQLREGIRLAEEEAAVHEALLDLARNERLIRLLGKMHEDSSLFSRFARDPLGCCQEENVSLPKCITLNALEKEAPTRLTGNVRHGSWDVEVAWDREGGFSARPLSGEPSNEIQPLNLPPRDRPESDS
jgi:hypothetical protein